MSIYDILMLVILVGSILFGLWKGLAWQIASLAAIFVSYFVALNFRGPLSTYISAAEPWNRFAAMLILFLGTSLIIWMLYGYMKTTIQRWRLKGFDAQAGALLGAFKGVLLCMLVTLFAVTLFGSNVSNSIIASKSGGYIATAINRLNSMVPSEIHAVIDKHIKQFNQNLANQDPGFINRSEEKFAEKLHTIRGKFRLPDSSTVNNVGDPQLGPQNPNNFSGRTNGSQPNQNGFQLSPSNGQNNGFRPPAEARTVGDELFDTVKQAGKKLLDDNFNR